MKKTLYILLTFLLFTALNCKSNDEIEKVADFFQTNFNEEKLVAEIDFSLSDSDLIKDIESQTKTDLCENMRFKAKMKYKDVYFEFSAFANKNCEWNTMPRNLIQILINNENQVLIDNELVKPDESLEKKVIKATKERIIGTERKNLAYLIEWNKGINPDLVKKRVFETLKGIKEYSNEISWIKFKKNIPDLTETEIATLKEEFTGIVGVNDYFPPPPPPPPKMENELTAE